jgi:NAD-dependent dihydropyrimidine dehydrogenase PreA subunit
MEEKMLIDQEACSGCGKCVPYCPMQAIIWHKKEKGKKPYSEIDREKCVECFVCYRANVCPKDAIKEEKLAWPRILRRAFSDPLYVHEGTDVPGRGTEEMKTNDVTGRFRDGYIGIGMEFGRPGTGTYFRDAEKAIKKLVPVGVSLEPLNPLTQLISNPQTGELKKEVRDERVLSAIVEFTIPLEKAQQIFQAIKEVAQEIDTVFSLDLISKVSPQGEIPLLKELEKAGLFRSVNGKVNVGLGRPLFKA